MHFVFDLETTGLPAKKERGGFYPFRMTSKYNTARIVSVSWIVLNSKLEEKHKMYYVIKPEGFDIPESSSKIHGITHKEAVKTGKPMHTVLKELETHLTMCDTMVAHNINFDMNILLSELYRQHQAQCIDHVFKMKRYCTMLHGQKHMQVKKFPKLSELYHYITGDDISNAHNALYDTEHCAMCYKALLGKAAPPPQPTTTSTA